MSERRASAASEAVDPVVPASAAVVGCGVIGAAWAARLLRSHGVPVRAYDPSPDAERILGEVAANAVAAAGDLGLPTEMAPLTICATIDEAVADVDLIQESVPERMEVKHATLSAIDAAAGADADHRLLDLGAPGAPRTWPAR